MINPIPAVALALAVAGAGAPTAPATESGALPAALDLSPYAGRVIYVDYWASWCGPCRASLPWLQSLQDRYGDRGLTVLTVNVDRDRAAAERFLTDLAIRLPVTWDPEGRLAAAQQLEGMPSSFVYGRDGTLRARHVGFDRRGVDDAEASLLALLAEEAPRE